MCENDLEMPIRMNLKIFLGGQRYGKSRIKCSGAGFHAE